MNKYDGIVGAFGVITGLIGVGYALGTRSKMAKISEKLDRSIEELANETSIDIPNDLVERAVEKAVAYEVKHVASKTADRVVGDVKRDIHKQVIDAVEKEYSSIKDAVLEELVDAASNIDARRVRSDVERAAEKKALEKFDDNLDDIVRDFKHQLNSTTKIYSTIAEGMNSYKAPTARETVLRFG